jgi:DNA-binding GntR family transcriptional regulator
MPGPARGTGKGIPKTSEGVEALERVIATISQRVSDGTYKPGQAIKQAKIAAELDVNVHFVRSGIEQLIKTGTLHWSNATSAYSRRAIVAAS